MAYTEDAVNAKIAASYAIGAQVKPRTAFDAIEQTAEQLTELERRAFALADRMAGSVPEAANLTQGGPQAPAAGVFGALAQTADAMSARITRIHNALNAIERQLP